MQIRLKAYLHFISRWRSLRAAIPPRHADARHRASPGLIYVAVVLALFLAILEVDAHRSELESLGFLGRDYAIPADFVGP
jgi:hypothetical protein